MVQAHGKQMLAAGPGPREEAPAKLSPGLLRIVVLNDVCWAYKNLPQLDAILALAAPSPPEQQLYTQLLGWRRALWTQSAAHLSSSDFYAALIHTPRANFRPPLLLPTSPRVS